MKHKICGTKFVSIDHKSDGTLENNSIYRAKNAHVLELIFTNHLCSGLYTTMQKDENFVLELLDPETSSSTIRPLAMTPPLCSSHTELRLNSYIDNQLGTA